MGDYLKKLKESFSSHKAGIDPELQARKQQWLSSLVQMEAELSDIQDSIDEAKAAGDTARLKEYNDLLKSKNNDYQSQLTESLKMFPDMQKFSQALQKNHQIASNVSSLISGILDVAESSKQIKEGQRAARNVKQFENVKPFKRSELLQDQIRTAKQANTAGAMQQATSGASGEIESQYAADKAAAAGTAGGQSGSFAANSQVASRARLKNLMELQRNQLGLRNQNDRNLNYLATQEIGENQAADVSERFRSQQDWNRFNFETRNAAGLEQAGRQNRRMSRNYMLGNVPNLSTMFMNPRMPYGAGAQNNAVPQGAVDVNNNQSVPHGFTPGYDGQIPMIPNYKNKIPMMDFSQDSAILDINKYFF